MHLIFGGAYQGKLDYAKERYKIAEQDVWDCAVAGDLGGQAGTTGDLGGQAGTTPANRIDYSKKVIDHLEAFVLACVKSGKEAKELLADSKELWNDSVIICEDISSGIVPCDTELRAWREMTGRTLIYLGKEAQEVTRIFCGIPQRVK